MTEPKDDFAASLAQLNAATPRELPPMHPDQFLAEAGRGGEMPSAKMASKYEAKYRKFCLDEHEQVEELEKVTDHILNDGWLIGREEWLHTKNGESFVVLKYLVPKAKAKPKKKAKEPGRRKPKQAPSQE